MTNTNTSKKNHQKKLPQLTQLNLEQLDNVVGAKLKGGHDWAIQ